MIASLSASELSCEPSIGSVQTTCWTRTAGDSKGLLVHADIDGLAGAERHEGDDLAVPGAARMVEPGGGRRFAERAEAGPEHKAGEYKHKPRQQKPVRRGMDRHDLIGAVAPPLSGGAFTIDVRHVYRSPVSC